VKTGNCSYSSNPYTTATYLGLNDPNLKEFLDLPEGLIASNGVRAGKVYYQGQQYDAYSVLTLNNEQYVVSPAMPLMLNPVGNVLAVYVIPYPAALVALSVTFDIAVF
jgi:hypothetical protein